MTDLDKIQTELGNNTETDAFLNLEGAIADIENAGGVCDSVVLKTLKRVASQLARAQSVFGDTILQK